MVQITVDTERDSTATLRHLLHFLEEELRHRGQSPAPPAPNPFTPSTIVSAPVTQSAPVPSSGGFSDMFGGNDASAEKHVDLFGNDNAPSQSAAPESQVASTPDMFSVFSHDAPSSEVQPTQSAESFITSQMTSEPTPTPSASQLLAEDDVHDVTEDLARQVWQTGSTRKRDGSLDLEPY